MFCRLAPRYDLFNRLVSLGRDRGWRRYAVTVAGPPRQGLVLDLATGTAELAIALTGKAGRVVGVDLCLDMMSRGREKAQKRDLDGRIAFLVGDALSLPFRDDSFDCAFISFALHNMTDIPSAIAEMRRVTKAGGHVVCLELTKPRSAVIGSLYAFYINNIVPYLVRWIIGGNEFSHYLPKTLEALPRAQELKGIMEEVGLRRVSLRRLGLGAVALHIGQK